MESYIIILWTASFNWIERRASDSEVTDSNSVRSSIKKIIFQNFNDARVTTALKSYCALIYERNFLIFFCKFKDFRFLVLWT